LKAKSYKINLISSNKEFHWECAEHINRPEPANFRAQRFGPNGLLGSNLAASLLKSSEFPFTHYCAWRDISFKHLYYPCIHESKSKSESKQLREVVQNILDEPIPERVRQWFLKLLRPSKGVKLISPAREKKAMFEEFDPYPPQGSQTITNYQNELLRLYDALEGMEGEEGHRFMRWVFSRRLGENLTPSVMAKLRERVNTAFYIRHLYSYVIVNNEDRRRMVFL
jgi:hypothetical protein